MQLHEDVMSRAAAATLPPGGARILQNRWPKADVYTSGPATSDTSWSDTVRAFLLKSQLINVSYVFYLLYSKVLTSKSWWPWRDHLCEGQLMFRDSQQFTHERACQMKTNQSTAYTSTISLMGLSFSRPPSTCPNPLQSGTRQLGMRACWGYSNKSILKSVYPALSIPPRRKHNHVSCPHFPSSVLSDRSEWVFPLRGCTPTAIKLMFSMPMIPWPFGLTRS